MPDVFDSHAHYTDEKFGDPAELLDSLFNDGVSGIVCASSDIADSRAALALAAGYPLMYATVGVHPHESAKVSPDWLTELRKLAEAPKAVAIGEIGLDYYYDFADKPTQKEVFDAQMRLAGELGLPVVIHDRDAHGDVFDIVRAHPQVRGVLHSCSVSAELAAEYVRHGYYISFSGVITFKNASRVCEVLASVPLERLLIETDCPYLAPHPMRGKLNHSGYLRYTAEKAAELKGVSLETLAQATHRNALDCFNIK